MTDKVPLPEPAAWQVRRNDHGLWASQYWEECSEWEARNCVAAADLRQLYTADQMHSHAAAVTAAKDAEIAGLRAELLREHADHKETIEDAAAVVHQNTALRADNTRLQNEVVIPLRERVKVLEDALRTALKVLQDRLAIHDNVRADDDQYEDPEEWRLRPIVDAARAALGDKT